MAQTPADDDDPTSSDNAGSMHLENLYSLSVRHGRAFRLYLLRPIRPPELASEVYLRWNTSNM